MKRVATSLRTDRPALDEPSPPPAWDGVSWGFTALDGLPDLEEASRYAPAFGSGPGPLRLSTGLVPPGFDQELRDALGNLWNGQEPLLNGGLTRELTEYEIEVLESLIDRRDAAVRLQSVLADDIAQFDDAAACVRGGRVVGLLADSISGRARRNVTDAVAEFESARHRFRVALVAVGVDNGMSGADLGQALSFSRQLASRYLKEARAKWPRLQQPATRRGRRR